MHNGHIQEVIGLCMRKTQQQLEIMPQQWEMKQQQAEIILHQWEITLQQVEVLLQQWEVPQ